MTSRDRVATFVFVCAALLPSDRALAQFSQQGPKLVGTGAVGMAHQGISVSLSADGYTALVGGYTDSSQVGAAWVWTRSGSVWTQLGGKLVGSGSIGASQQGFSVSVSADGKTALVGGPFDNNGEGAVWVWTFTFGVWTQQGSKLVGSGGGHSRQGYSVSLSADGNTALAGGPYDNGDFGAVWVWTRSGNVWTQQGPKLVGSGVSLALQGAAVSLSGDGNTALVGGPADGISPTTGAAWVWTRSGGVWTQQRKLIGVGGVGGSAQGSSVSLSADGNTALVGGGSDNNGIGAAWVFTRSGGGIWTQQGGKLVGSGAQGFSQQGRGVSLSPDGNTALVGGDNDATAQGAAWVWTRPTNGTVWTQQGAKRVGAGLVAQSLQGFSVSLSADGHAAVGGHGDNGNVGAAWIFFDASAPICTYGLSLASASYDASGGGGTVSVTTSPGCAWTAVSNDPAYLHVTGGATGSGSGTVTYTLDPNVGAANVANAARAGTITIAAQTFTVNQTGCTFGLSSTGAAFGAAADVRRGRHHDADRLQLDGDRPAGLGLDHLGRQRHRPGHVAVRRAGQWHRPHADADGHRRGARAQLHAHAVGRSPLKPLVPGTRSAFTLNDATDQRWMSTLDGGGPFLLRAADARRDRRHAGDADADGVPRRWHNATGHGRTRGHVLRRARRPRPRSIRVTQADVSARAYRLRVVESTLWTNWWFVAGEYSSFTLLRNTTGAPINATLTWRSLAGTVVGTQTLVDPARRGSWSPTRGRRSRVRRRGRWKSGMTASRRPSSARRRRCRDRRASPLTRCYRSEIAGSVDLIRTGWSARRNRHARSHTAAECVLSRSPDSV